MFLRLSVFAGGFDLEAAHGVCGEDGATEDDTLEWLICEFETPLKIRSVSVHENYNPGAVIKLTAYGPHS